MYVELTRGTPSLKSQKTVATKPANKEKEELLLPLDTLGLSVSVFMSFKFRKFHLTVQNDDSDTLHDTGEKAASLMAHKQSL